MNKYDIEPIGFIKSPYMEREEIPRQGFHAPEVEAVAVIDEKWADAMMGLENIDRLMLLFLFHRSCDVHMTENKPWLGGERGVFATRSPHRPNHIGVSEVEVLSVQGREIRFKGPDMLDGTPLIDIKPAVSRK
ncbi:tRNA (N6-threonylcarbamoyladenosine(37)-N6)-methyltransferase TrmO [Dethiosulfovibrio salsuginis]|uniref:tRNA-Thr(GGU) m(6)t(6)A37 methyltransferase TsaA n=1 Tax=Dethiosulfovibrio salsuginis TaxID=561720 RepID=A0A1X7KDY6_9BACT|nr:tRNA (N6-threonylcarbamoyladenosine(37)-N6)-methyltransferase TrmO [Dethiosulfovibrio salsuginis]SMG39390.1 tRNA-Thr(GGU) m(6)t(6)A37 methyltransferase TsaA [Dethiosulfovibrio salsuginis]